MAAFAQYYQEEAWIWEHQALVRARAIAGDNGLRAQFTAQRERILLADRDPAELREAVCEMRDKMREQLGSKADDGFNIKQDRGGITDIEFIVQFATLRWPGLLGAQLGFTDNVRLLEALQTAQVISDSDAKTLVEAYKAYRERNHQLSLQDDSGVVPNEAFATARNQVKQIWHRIMDEP